MNRLIKMIDMDDAENYCFITVQNVNDALDNVIEQYNRGGMTRFDFLSEVENQGMTCSIAFPEDYIEIRDDHSNYGE